MIRDKKVSDQKQTLKKIIDNNLFILKYLLKYTPVFLITTCLFTAIAEVIVFFEQTYSIKYLTDVIQYKKPFMVAIQFLALISVLVAFRILFNGFYEHYMKPRAMEKLNKGLRKDLYEKASSMDLACYDNPEFYNDFVWSTSEASKRAEKSLEHVDVLFSRITSILCTGGFIFSLNNTGLIFVVVTTLLVFFFSLSFNKLTYKMEVELKPKTRKRDYFNRVFYLGDYAKELRLQNIGDKLKKDFKDTASEIYQTIDAQSKKQVLLHFCRNALFTNIILDCFYMIYLVYQAVVLRSISYGSIVALFNSSWRTRDGLMGITALLPDIQQNSLYIERIRSFLSYEQQITEKENAQSSPLEPAVLELNDVSFSYRQDGENVIKNVSLKINPYEKIALVGYNGAGKTTLIKLLMRLYDVSDGEITLDGVNIKDYKLEEYRNSYGTVFQDYQIFAASVAENVLMDEIRTEKHSEIIDALKKSGFSERLNNLEHGLATPITREFNDTGVNLSGGEAQKLAIARVFAKPCQFIILDEPSSALDPISEYHLNEAMLEAAKNKTVIFISHRLSSTRMADRIYMLENGQIIEQGSHDELMALNGKYAEMFNLQAEKYKIEVA